MITSTEFNTLRKGLIDGDAVTKTITLDQIDVTPSGIEGNYIKVKGQTVQVAGGFWAKLAKTVNVNSQLATSFMKNDDQALYATLIKAIKQYKTIRSDKALDQYQLVADPHSRRVVDIVKGSSGGRLSMATICDITENILSDNSHMSLESANTHHGMTSFNFINENSVAFPDAGPDEEFKFGFTISTTPTSTKLGLYNHRLICSNGMKINIGSGQISDQVNISESFRLRSLKPGNIEQFMNQIKTLKADGFIPPGFKQTVQMTQGTKASFLELENTIASIMSEFPDNESAKDYKKLVQSYFPAYGMTAQRALKSNIDVYQLNDRQKSNIRTGMSVWDVINNLTFLGSNKSEFNINNPEGLKAQGGSLFNKAMTTGLDLQYATLQTI